MSEKSTKYSYDEFKLMYESTEKVTDRRLQTNRWNYTICTAILIAIAGIVKYSVSNIPFFYIGLSFTVVLCGMAVLFCRLWIGQIRDFKSLNHAKFQVLNQMAPNLEYDLEHPDILTPYCPFEKEWHKLKEIEALQEQGKTNFIALKSTNIEYFIPKAFIALFLSAVIVVSVFLIPHKDKFENYQNRKANTPVSAQTTKSKP
jgi:hypothetical protein